MRLLQILALAAFFLLAIKLVILGSAGYFDGVAVSAANAQEQKNKTDTKTENADENKPEIAEVKGLEEIENRSSRPDIQKRLSERRDAIAKREKDLDLREQLLKAAEQRLRSKLDKLKKLEEEKESRQEAASKNATKDLVVIYENMKPKDAANIFNSLSIDIMHMLATAIQPRKMSAILAEMDVKKAERLTVEIARRAAHQQQAGKKQRTLPKIGG